MEYSTIQELIELARAEDRSVSEVVIQVECEETGKDRQEIMESMQERLQVMMEAVEEGRKGKVKSTSGMVGGDASKFSGEKEISESENLYRTVITYAVAIAEVNAGMGKIVAGPTAGSSGIVPAIVLALGEELNLSRDEMLKGLFTASGLGSVVARKATLAGAAGGCQAECGVASAMAAGAAVELYKGTPGQIGHAFALALKNQLGLVCDPVAGLVEVPCVKRNGFAASHALTAANMALAGIESVIPADEVIEAMYKIGNMMPGALKETSLGGLAVTGTAQKIKDKLET